MASLPFARPSFDLDARVAATAHFESRPVIHRMRWPAAAAALFLVGCGLAAGWAMRGVAGTAWLPLGTEWQAAGLRDLGAATLPGGTVVRSAEATYIRTQRFRDPAAGATLEIQTIEPRLIIGRPHVD